jgi:hypothetical protein
MQPTTPIVNEHLQQYETVFAKDQPEYKPLSALVSKDGKVITRWQPTEEERRLIAGGSDILLVCWTFHRPLQPLYMAVTRSEQETLDEVERIIYQGVISSVKISEAGPDAGR